MSKRVVVLILVLLFLPIVYSVEMYPSDDTQDTTISSTNIFERILNVLNSILEKLNIIAEKNTTVNVQPQVNVTVQAPIVNVNPNLTLPEKECKWENYNIELTDFSKQYFTIPVNIMFSQVNFTSVKILVNALGYGGGYLYINDNRCDILVNRLYDACPQYFTTGINKITNFYPATPDFIMLQLQVKHENC